MTHGARAPAQPGLDGTHLTLFSCCCGRGRRARRFGAGPSLAIHSGSSFLPPALAAIASATMAGTTKAAARGVRAGLLAAESGAGSDVLLPVRRMPGVAPPGAAPAAAAAGPACSSDVKPVRSTLPPRLCAMVTLPLSHS